MHSRRHRCLCASVRVRWGARTYVVFNNSHCGFDRGYGQERRFLDDRGGRPDHRSGGGDPKHRHPRHDHRPNRRLVLVERQLPDHFGDGQLHHLGYSGLGHRPGGGLDHRSDQVTGYLANQGVADDRTGCAEFQPGCGAGRYATERADHVAIDQFVRHCFAGAVDGSDQCPDHHSNSLFHHHRIQHPDHVAGFRPKHHRVGQFDHHPDHRFCQHQSGSADRYATVRSDHPTDKNSDHRQRLAPDHATSGGVDRGASHGDSDHDAGRFIHQSDQGFDHQPSGWSDHRADRQPADQSNRGAQYHSDQCVGHLADQGVVHRPSGDDDDRSNCVADQHRGHESDHQSDIGFGQHAAECLDQCRSDRACHQSNPCFDHRAIGPGEQYPGRVPDHHPSGVPDHHPNRQFDQ